VIASHETPYSTIPEWKRKRQDAGTAACPIDDAEMPLVNVENEGISVSEPFRLGQHRRICG
jgi:hypothetical protein